ncbi:hypothetical protein B0T19DRAFT_422386 [Cercophora scortea]|uniref:Uncharacterized protein n=1 Tax=Cercophora scortea TaxID=314031 RepID=A0AAE0ME18_9PEZI|nr:hypothetical protein B0T19DRAFT_422386 [Cercophora scortea]
MINPPVAAPPLPTAPARSLPRTPSRHRARQLSTDSTLSEILRSTEKRLQEGTTTAAVTRRSRASTSPGKRPGTGRSSQEFLLDPNTNASGQPLWRSRSQTRTPSPNKRLTGNGHRRQDSQTSVLSEADSLLVEEALTIPLDVPAGLTSPSRNKTKQSPEKQLSRVDSFRSSVSSALSLSTISEDEVSSAGGRTAETPPSGNSTEIDKSTIAGRLSEGDPFASASLLASSSFSSSRPATSQGWPARPQRSQDLCRESLERSLRLRRATVDQIPLSAPRGGRPMPSPELSDRRPSSLSSDEKPDVLLPLGAGPSTRGSKQHLSLNTSILRSIVLPPPTIPGPADPRGHLGIAVISPVKASQTTAQLQRRDSHPATPTRSPDQVDRAHSPTRRLDARLSCISKKQRRASVSSSIYSQDAKEILGAVAAAKEATTAETKTVEGADEPNQSTTQPPSPRPLPSTAEEEKTAETPKAKEAQAQPAAYRTSAPAALALTVAELRRMNSVISNASSAASGDGKGSPTIPGMRGGGFSPTHRRSGSRNYLSLGSPPKGPRQAGSGRHSVAVVGSGSPRRRGGATAAAAASGKGNRGVLPPRPEGEGSREGEEEEKENVEGVMGVPPGGFKMAVGDFSFEQRVRSAAADARRASSPSPKSKAKTKQNNTTPSSSPRRRGADNEHRRSEDSMASLGLYDQDGFLIATPIRSGAMSSPGLRV